MGYDMTEFIYPESWNRLNQAPSARAELISFIRDIVEWNDDLSYVKKNGADDLIGFFYDVYRIDKGASQWVGKLIFPDEVSHIDAFIDELSRFIRAWEATTNLSRIHQATMPQNVIDRARKVVRKLEEQGVPHRRG